MARLCTLVLDRLHLLLRLLGRHSLLAHDFTHLRVVCSTTTKPPPHCHPPLHTEGHTARDLAASCMIYGGSARVAHDLTHPRDVRRTTKPRLGVRIRDVWTPNQGGIIGRNRLGLGLLGKARPRTAQCGCGEAWQCSVAVGGTGRGRRASDSVSATTTSRIRSVMACSSSSSLVVSQGRAGVPLYHQGGGGCSLVFDLHMCIIYAPPPLQLTVP